MKEILSSPIGRIKIFACRNVYLVHFVQLFFPSSRLEIRHGLTDLLKKENGAIRYGGKEL